VREQRFVVEQVHLGYRATCTWCLESSGPVSSRSKAVKWAARHATAELDLDMPGIVGLLRSGR
jgi:hypothetical protein